MFLDIRSSCREYCGRFGILLAWQVNYVLSQHGLSTVPFWFLMLVTVMTSTQGLDAFVFTFATRENYLRLRNLRRADVVMCCRRCRDCSLTRSSRRAGDGSDGGGDSLSAESEALLGGGGSASSTV